jgi:DNA-binding MarR family transcriptional regulator
MSAPSASCTPTITELATALHYSVVSVTKRLTFLQQLGWVHRQRDPQTHRTHYRLREDS